LANRLPRSEPERKRRFQVFLWRQILLSLITPLYLSAYSIFQLSLQFFYFFQYHDCFQEICSLI